MVPLKVLTLVVAGKARIVPIWIGPTEAAQIGMALEHVKFARPMTHDLMLDALTNLDARVDSMVIYGSKGQMFFAHLVLSQGGRLITLDARPSDAIALALRQDAPLHIEETVLDAWRRSRHSSTLYPPRISEISNSFSFLSSVII